MTTECQIIIFCLDPQLRVIPQIRYLGRRDRQEIARVAHLIIACNSLISYAILYEYYKTQVVPLVVFVIPSVAVSVGEKDGYAAHALLLAFVVVSRACVVYALAPAARRTAPTSTVAACHHRASLAAARRLVTPPRACVVALLHVLQPCSGALQHVPIRMRVYSARRRPVDVGGCCN